MIGKGDSGSQVYFFDSESALMDAEAIVGPMIGRGLMIPTMGSSYEDFASFVDTTLGKARPNDWVMVDKADAIWTWTRDYYIANHKGGSLAEARREANKRGVKPAWGGVTQVIDRSEWAIINDYYFEPMLRLINSASDRPKLHLMFVTEIKNKDDDDDLGSEFHGQKPTGQKQLPYQMRTLVHMEKMKKPGQGEQLFYTFSTTERHGSGRENIERSEYNNFGLSYYVSKAGWSVKQPTSTPAIPPKNQGSSPSTPTSSPEPADERSPSVALPQG